MSSKKTWVLLCICLLSSAVFAVNTTWTGGTSSNWDTGINWDTAATPGIGDLAVVYGIPVAPYYPTILSGATANMDIMFLGNGDCSLTVEAGATMNMMSIYNSAYTGYVDGTSTMTINGNVNCTGTFLLGNGKWVDPCDPNIVKIGHSDVVLSDPAATLSVGGFLFGWPEYVLGKWINTEGTGIVHIEKGTVTLTGGTLNGLAGAKRVGIDIKSASNAMLDIPTSAVGSINWVITMGNIIADAGLGVVVVDPNPPAGRIICTARAYDPNVDTRRTPNREWDNGGNTQSVYDHWNYKSSTVPWPVDILATTSLASWGNHPIADADFTIGYLTIGWQPVGTTADDFFEVADGVTLRLTGASGGVPDPNAAAGDLSLGGNGQTFISRGKGTVVVNGGNIYCGGLGIGAGNADYWVYGQGHVEVNNGLIDCNNISMNVPNSTVPAEPFGLGSIAINDGTINVRDNNGIIGLDAGNGIVMSGNSTLVIEGDMDASIAAAMASGKITAQAGDYIVHDYNVSNAGKTTVQSAKCPGGVNGDCNIDINDLKMMVDYWLDQSSAATGDSIYLHSTGAVNPGLWLLALNTDTPGAYLSNSPISGGWALFNNGLITPNPNRGLVGDINGDGISDLVTVGVTDANMNIFEAFNVATVGGVGNLLEPAIGGAGWPNNYTLETVDATDFFVADVDGDGFDDAVTRKHAGDGTFGNPWNGMSFWEARHSDSAGLGSATNSWAGGVGTFAYEALMGDFNGDGAVDYVENDPNTGLFDGRVSIPGTGFSSSTDLRFWGQMDRQTNHIATLVGDIDGDGMDDIVQIDDRNADGVWAWASELTILNAAIPAGIEIAGGPPSWNQPFTLHVNSTLAIPLLADLNNDGRDDLVIYEEYDYDDGTGTRTWSRLMASYTDDPNGGLFTNGLDETVVYDWLAVGGFEYNNLIPIVGNAHDCASLIGDLNSDCTVNLMDFALMAEHWMQSF